MRLSLKIVTTSLPLPWPAALDLDLQSHAEDGANQDNDRQHCNVFQSWGHDHRTDDVACHEKLQAENDGTAKILLEASAVYHLSDENSDGEPRCSSNGPNSNIDSSASL